MAKINILKEILGTWYKLFTGNGKINGVSAYE